MNVSQFPNYCFELRDTIPRKATNRIVFKAKLNLNVIHSKMSLTTHTNNTPQSWLEWFQSRESGKTIDKNHQEELFATFNSNISKINCIDAVIKHNETVYLHKASFGQGNVIVFHHLTSAGGTIYDQNGRTYGFIQGLGNKTAVAMTPDGLPASVIN